MMDETKKTELLAKIDETVEACKADIESGAYEGASENEVIDSVIEKLSALKGKDKPEMGGLGKDETMDLPVPEGSPFEDED